MISQFYLKYANRNNHLEKDLINEEKYFEELQKKVISETKSDNGINERWNEVLQMLDQLSIEYAKEIQAETGVRYEKYLSGILQLGSSVLP